MNQHKAAGRSPGQQRGKQNFSKTLSSRQMMLQKLINAKKPVIYRAWNFLPSGVMEPIEVSPTKGANVEFGWVLVCDCLFVLFFSCYCSVSVLCNVFMLYLVNVLSTV